MRRVNVDFYTLTMIIMSLVIVSGYDNGWDIASRGISLATVLSYDPTTVIC